MSWGTQYSCSLCEKKDVCKDAIKIQNAVHNLNNEEHHGSGTVIVVCHKMQSTYK